MNYTARKKSVAAKKKTAEKRPLSLHPLKLEEALRAAIATGPITDPKIKKPKKSGPK